MGATGCHEMLVTRYWPPSLNTPKQQIPHLHCGRSMKSHMYILSYLRTVLVPECYCQPTALPQQPHALLQLYAALFVCWGQYRSYPGADHKVQQMWFMFYFGWRILKIWHYAVRWNVGVWKACTALGKLSVCVDPGVTFRLIKGL